MLRVAKSRVTTVEERKKVEAEKCEYVFDLHMSKVNKELKMLLLHLLHVNVKTTGGFINIPVEDFHVDKIAP
jgi:hypothetical protein